MPVSDQSQSVKYLLNLLPNLNDEQLKKCYLNLLKWTEPLALEKIGVDTHLAPCSETGFIENTKPSKL